MKVNSEICIGCGTCMCSCPMNAISFDENHKAKIDTSKCVNCKTCASLCPMGAIS